MDSSLLTAISVISGCITALISATVPALISRSNNKLQERMLKREMYIKRQIDVIEKYLSSVGKVLDHGSTTDFQETQGVIFLYVPKEYWEKIEKLNNHLNNNAALVKQGKTTCYNLLAELSQSLTEYMQSIKE